MAISDSTIALKTGFYYDSVEQEHLCEWDPLHAEAPYRTKSILTRLDDPQDNLIEECLRLKGREATYAEIQLVHTPELIKQVNESCANDSGENWINLKNFSEIYNDVYINKMSEECALRAAGGAVVLAGSVWRGEVKNGLAVVRPPGHHASPDESNGFCIYNNVAIAAQYLLTEKKAQRILIVDWDVHHGQGTQRAFYNDKRVLYFSIHRYEQGDFWPNLPESNFDHIGEGEGKGYNINVPLNKTGLGDAEYLAILHQILLPVAFEFNPEVIFISAGYDAAIGCPEGRMMVSPALYGHYTHALSCLAGGKVAVVLEGGYCAESLAEGVACTLEALLGRPVPPLPPMQAPDPSVVESILNVISALRDHWHCLAFQDRPGDQSTKSIKKGLLKTHVPEIVFNGPSEPSPNEAYGCTPFYRPSQAVDLRWEINALCDQYDQFRKSTSSRRTCFAYDDSMMHHVCEVPTVEVWDIPERIVWIEAHLKRSGLLQKCHSVEIVPVGRKDFGLFHSANYAEVLGTASAEAFVETVKYHTDPRTTRDDKWAPDLFASKDSVTAIRYAVGALQSVVDEVWSGRSLNGFAIVRPPGHHAHADHPAGFCFANNVGIVAKNLLEKHGLKRILIVDWDVHHGDGVQEAFYDDPRVLYISLHRGMSGPSAKENDFYPIGVEKEASQAGKGAGIGRNVNIPWSQPQKTDGDYVAAFLQLVMPIAYEFAPEMTLVCCGFDAAAGDKGDCLVSPRGFYLMTKMLKALAGGRLVLTLEGGYRQEVLEQCSEAVMRALMDLPLMAPAAGPLVPSNSAVADIKRALDVQTAHWQSLQYRVLLEPILRPSSSPSTLRRHQQVANESTDLLAGHEVRLAGEQLRDLEIVD